MQPQRPLLVPRCGPTAELGLPAETRSRQRSCKRWLATCRPLPLPRRRPGPLPTSPTKGPAAKPSWPQTLRAQPPVRPGTFLACARVLTRTQPRARGLHWQEYPTAGSRPHHTSSLTTSVSKLPASLSPHPERTQSRYVCTARSKGAATSGKHTSLWPAGSLDHVWQEEFQRSPPAAGPRPSGLGRNRFATATPSPPQTPPLPPETLLRASPQHQPCPKSTPTSACSLTSPLLPQPHPSHPQLPASPISTHPAPHAPLLPEPFQIPLLSRNLPLHLSHWPASPHPPLQATACSFFCFFEHE